jgi:transcriptional regulator with PAS, ATPase and Fis domain
VGGRRLVLWSDVVLHDQGGQVNGLLSVGADVTEQRHAESARDRAIEELETALGEVEALKARLEDEVVYLQDEIKTTHDFQDMIGESDALKYVMHRIEQVAAPETTVLIEGETGVGKELMARAIHHGGRWWSGYNSWCTCMLTNGRSSSSRSRVWPPEMGSLAITCCCGASTMRT